jgi:hypothetical protein
VKNLPLALHFALLAGRCQAWRNECMRNARAAPGPERALFARSARVWNHTALRHLERGKRWYADALESGRSV